ncbi:MAG: YggT family protein [Coriobacteriia bacterium]|nr:YggT family protein [Coriobacteriia bacterium]MBN2822581.1 YggT family protein [Coriobacteriia bacterium]
MSLASIVSQIISFYGILIFVYVIMSWFRPRGVFYDLYRVLGSLCEPYIGLFRRIVPTGGGLDFSPMVALLVLQLLVQPLLVRILLSLGL